MANPTAQKPKFSVAISQPNYQKLINNTLKDPQRASRFIASITSAVSVNPDLQECDTGSILSGALLGESLNLSPSPQLGQYYLVPFEISAVYDKNGNIKYPACKKATFILGYKGYIQLALRSGKIADLDAFEIREGEYLGKDPRTAKPRFHFIEDDALRESLPVIGYMAYLELTNGFLKTIYWSREKMMAHADQYSKAFDRESYDRIQNGEADASNKSFSSNWYKDFDGMARKTLLRQLISKWAPMSTEMEVGIDKDNHVISYNDNGAFTDDPAMPELPDTSIPNNEALPQQDSGEAPPPQQDAATEYEEVNLADLANDE